MTRSSKRSSPARLCSRLDGSSPRASQERTRIRFFSNVLKLAIREPILVAKTVGSAAVLSGDRVALGVGLSWMPEEFRFLNQDMRTRGARVDEAIAVIRALLGGGMVEFHGVHYDFEPLQLSPAPARPVPIFVGGTSRAALRRAAHLAEGWISMIHTRAELKALIDELLGLRRTAGRAQARFEIKVLWAEPLQRHDVTPLEDLGVTDLLVTPWLFEPASRPSIEGKRESLVHFADRVISRPR